MPRHLPLTRVRALTVGAFCFRARRVAKEIMATLKIETGTDERLWVTLTRFSADDLARLKKIPGRQWNPERKQWSFPNNEETRAALAEIVALPPAPPPKMLAVKPKTDAQPSRKPRGRYVSGREKPLTLNLPHPLIKQVDDELVLRGMALRRDAQVVRTAFAKLFQVARRRCRSN